MGACTSKTKKNKEKHLKNDETNGNHNHKKESIGEQIQQQSTTDHDKFDNVPFIDSEEKLTSSAPPPPTTEPKNTDEKDNDERTTVKTNFETNVTYSSAETIDKLKQEVYTFLREKIFPFKDEKDKLIDYVHKRILGSSTDLSVIDETLEQCFNDIEKHQHPDNDNNDKIKRRLMNIVSVYVSSQSSDNSFLKALYDKLGPLLDLNTLNAETNEHEVVNVTVTKTVRQVFVDGSSSIVLNPDLNSTNELPNSVIHISNHDHNIPVDLPDDIRQQGQFDLSEEQETNFEDRYHNNRSFQNEYPVNHPDVDTAATKIQAQFRGHLVRRDLDKIKHENKDDVTSDQEEEEEEANDDEKDQTLSYDEQLQQEHAAISIQAQYRGYQVRKHLQELTDHNEQDIHQIPDTNRFNDQFEAGENNQVPLGRELTQLSEDFERHTQIPRDSNFDREVHEQYFNESDDDDDNNMNNSPLDQAATRIQASYRGYKTRKELGTISNHSHTGQGHGDEIHNKNILSPSAEGNKVLANDDEDNEAAAVKIQAAYRGYRVRKELEK